MQETASVRVPAAVTGLEELLAKSANATLPASRDVGPKRIAGGLLAISVGATVLAALAAFGAGAVRLYHGHQYPAQCGAEGRKAR